MEQLSQVVAFLTKNKYFYVTSNPYLPQQTRSQIRYSKVWFGIIGPKFIESNLNGMSYVNLLSEVMEEKPLEVVRNMK